MPTATDPQLADRLADQRTEFASFRSAVETELRLIRKVGNWILGVAVGIVAAMITGAATVGWSASAVVSEVKHQGERLDKLELRLDAMERKHNERLDSVERKLDTLISRTGPAPAVKPGG